MPLRLALTLAALLGLSTSTPAQPLPGESPADGVAMDPRLSSIDMDLRIDPARGLLVQNTSLEVRGHALRRLSFALNRGLTVERVDAERTAVEFRQAGGRLELFMSPPIDDRRVLRLRITGTPLRDGVSAIEPARVLLDPQDHWYPTLPGSWADWRVTVRVPPGWAAVAPGTRASDATTEWSWRSTRPGRSIAVVAAPGMTLTEATIPNASVRVAAPSGQLDAERVAAAVRHPLAWLSGALAPYPFDGFTLVLLPGLERRIRASGLLAVPADTPLLGAADGADLLAGQWFGELVAGDGPWIDSFAAWYATVYARDRALDLPAEIARLRRQYFELPSARDVPIARAERGSAEAVVRGKGSAAPEMVRLAVGDRQVRQAVRELFQMPIAPPLSFAQMRSAFERQAGSESLRSFNDWFDRSGAPEFDTVMQSSPSPDGDWRVDLVLRQIRGVYSLPVEVEFVGPEQRHREVIRVENETTKVSYSLPFRPSRLEIDPLGKLFRRDSG